MICICSHFSSLTSTIVPYYSRTIALVFLLVYFPALFHSNRDASQRYDLVVSIRLGRSSNKEQYAFVYR